MTLLDKNKIIIASAGGRKTTHLVKEALKINNKKVLLTTYTLENLDQIKTSIVKKNGFIPENISILTWYKFLLRDGVHPYQNFILNDKKIKSIDFESIPPRFIDKKNNSYFINKAENIYQDRVSDFVYQTNQISGGLVIKRLEKIFDYIFIDEMQDLSGWDQDLIELIFRSSISTTLVGDPRQSTYSTTNSLKNKGRKGENMTYWIKSLSKQKICKIEEWNTCYRCNQSICNFADSLYPFLMKTNSVNYRITGHDGIFFKKRVEIPTYIRHYKPVILRYWVSSDTMGLQAVNIGVVKGRTFQRVLIFPTKPMIEFLKTKDLSKAGDISKLYVAVTRAQYSVTFVID